MIVTDKEQLKIKSEVVSVEDGEKIALELINELRTSGNGIGISANQICINKRVCVINVKDPLVLINPEIVEASEEMFAFVEGCLSFPNESVKTARHKWVKVKADNHKETLYFTILDDDSEKGYKKDQYLHYAYETACVQHEIDHLDGITMYDRELKLEPLKRKSPKIGRNTKVLIRKGEETQTIKYKKINKLLEDGWALVEV